MSDDSKNPLTSWLRQPGSYLGLIATSISLATFLLVYAYPGKLTIVLPDRIGFGLTHDDLSIVIPLTFTNTGAPRTVRHVSRLSAVVESIRPIDIPPDNAEVRWRFEYRYAKKEDAGFAEDKLVYENRAIPFALFGGASTQKTFEMVQVGRGFPKKTIEGFRITVRAATESGKFSSRSLPYHCRHMQLREKDYQYCHVDPLEL